MLFLSVPCKASLVPTVFAGSRPGWCHVKVVAAKFVAMNAMRLGLADFIMLPKARKVCSDKMLFLENLLNRLSGTIAAINDKWVHFQFRGPLGNRQGFALVGQEGVRATVISLFDICGPSAVARLVIARIIAAFNRISIRCSAHIFQKITEVIPARTNGNPSATIIRKRLIVGIITPGPHTSPNAVSSSAIHSMFVAHPATMILA